MTKESKNHIKIINFVGHIKQLATMKNQIDPNSLKEGEDFYYTLEGYKCFTSKYHLKRGYCCKSGCKHCPYGFDKKTGTLKK